MYVYEICLREQKQIGISYLAFSSLRVDSQIVWWKCMERLLTRKGQNTIVKKIRMKVSIISIFV